MEKKGNTRLIIGILTLILGLAMIGFSLTISHEVVKKRRGRRPNPRHLETIPHHELLVDTTDGGVTWKRGLLWSTWDRSEPRVKRACPT